MKPGSPIRTRPSTAQAGFTVVELSIALATVAVLAAVGVGGFRQYGDAMSARKAAVQLAADVGLTRSFAIQRRENVSLVIDETNLTYVVRDTAGTVLMRRAFGAGTEIPLTVLLMNTAGDSLTFNSRGLMSNNSAVITVQRFTRTHTVGINALGRIDLN
jgi:Tfp pilus assembly protein FimT